MVFTLSFHQSNRPVRRWLAPLLLLSLLLGAPLGLQAQSARRLSTPAVSVSNLLVLSNLVVTIHALPSTNEQIAAFQVELTNAWKAASAIINRPPPAYRRTANMNPSISSPGWYHPGASVPDFNNVDVRQSQELIYADKEYITSDLNPGLVFRGVDLEFSHATKYFITNRALPRRCLSETEMLELNRLYRIIGRCQTEISRLEHPMVLEVETNAPSPAEESAPSGPLATIQRIPRQTRLLYGSLAIGALLVLVLGLRLARGKH